VSHSHLSPRHLLKQIESDRSKRTNRDIRPRWLTELVEFAADLFDPLSEVARVGFDCQLAEDGWSVVLYLGAVEQVGGKHDGQSQHVGFQFDVRPLLERFTRVDELSWNVLPDGPEPAAAPRSLLVLEGIVSDNRVRLTIRSAAATGIGPGLRQLPDGRFEAV